MKEFNIKLRIEYFLLGLRDKFGIPFQPKKELNKLDIEEGQIILDYGCGIGSYTFPAARLVGEKGKVYALDKQPLSIRKVKKRILREELHNINTILSDRDTGLPAESADIILLYGVLPEVEDRNSLLKELHRVLKPDGYISTRFCFRMKKDVLLETVLRTGLYVIRNEADHIVNFSKKE